MAHDHLPPVALRFMRRRLGMTQAELGRLLNFGPNTISRWELGKQKPAVHYEVLMRLVCDVPGVIEHLHAMKPRHGP